MILYFSRQPQNQLRYNIAIKSHIILLILIVQVYVSSRRFQIYFIKCFNKTTRHGCIQTQLLIRKIKSLYIYTNIIVDTPPLSRSQYLAQNSFRLPLQCVYTKLVNQLEENLQKYAIRVGVVCLYIYFCLFLLASPNVIILRYACCYRYLSTQNYDEIKVVPNVGRLAIHSNKLAIQSIVVVVCSYVS